MYESCTDTTVEGVVWTLDFMLKAEATYYWLNDLSCFENTSNNH